MKTQFKQNKWYNFGDVNPRIHGGIFVKREDTTIDVVSTHNKDEICGEDGYIFDFKTEYISELIEAYNKFKENPDESRGVASYCDWKRYIQLEEDGWVIDDIMMLLAPDMLSYSGGDCEAEQVNNYWKTLRSHGIRLDRI
jgi:hypothetical protein